MARKLTPKQFDDLTRGTRMGQVRLGRESNRTLTALRRHLVDGISATEAKREQDGLSNSAFYAAMKRLFSDTCPHCGQKLPKRKTK